MAAEHLSGDFPNLLPCRWLHLTNGRYAYGGYHYSHWHQGDLLCKSDGCNDVLFLGYVIFMQGVMLVFVPSVLEVFPVFARHAENRPHRCAFVASPDILRANNLYARLVLDRSSAVIYSIC
jgi:hypothetical protein